MCTLPLALVENPRMSSVNLPQSSGTLKLVDSMDKQIHPFEDADQNSEMSHTQIGMFGDFCLMCGEMIDGEGFDGGSAYCSEECEYHQHLTSDSDWCDLSMEGYQLPSYGGSTAVSSAKTTPLNSPHLPPSDRLAILCSGPPPCELLLPLDLGERLLGAKAVAERYLDTNRDSFEDDGDVEDTTKDLTVERADQQLDPDDCTASKDTSAQANSKLKSRPALAQLSDFNHLTCLSEQLAKKEDPSIHHTLLPQSISLVDLTSPSLTEVGYCQPTSSNPRSSRRVSEPLFGPVESLSSSPPTHRPLRSSFSFSPTASQSHIFNRSNQIFKKKS